jgi:hypothetical protein
MKHEELQILVSAYHDGELNPQEQALVEAHLAECAECAEALRAYQRLGRTVAALPRGTPSRELWLRVREALPTQRRRTLWRRLVPVVSTLTVLVVAVTVTLTLNLQKGRGTAPAGLGERAEPVQKANEEPRTLTDEEDYAASPAVPGGVEVAPSQPGLEGVTPAPIPSPPAREALPPTLDSSFSYCYTQPLSLQLVAETPPTDAGLAFPQLRGSILNRDGSPLASAHVVVSGTSNWLGHATADAEGFFSMSLPSAGVYRMAVWAADELFGPTAVGHVWEEGENGRTYAWNCLVALYEDLLSVVFGPHDVVTITLRVR